MRAGPVVSLILSILVGIAAVFFGRGWLNSEADAARPVVQTVVEVEPMPLAKIYVANAAIERGDIVSVDSLRLVDWPADFVPLGAISDPSDFINPDGSFPSSLGVIVPGEPVLLNKLSSQTVRDTLAQLIEPGQRAVSVEVDDATGVAGFILPDHRVDVNSFREVRSNASSDKIQRGELLLSNIRVLAVDQSFAEDLDGAKPARTVTLQVTPEQASKLGVAIEAGTIGLALRRADDDDAEPVKAAPKPVRAVPVRRAPAKPAFTNIRVIAGESEETVSAPVSQSNSQTGN